MSTTKSEGGGHRVQVRQPIRQLVAAVFARDFILAIGCIAVVSSSIVLRSQNDQARELRLIEAGLEHPADYPGKARLSTESDAKSDALSAGPLMPTDPGFGRIVAVWLTPPEALKALVWELVDGSSPFTESCAVTRHQGLCGKNGVVSHRPTTGT